MFIWLVSLWGQVTCVTTSTCEWFFSAAFRPPGRGYSPQILVGKLCAAAKWKMGPGSGTSSRSSVKMRGSGTSLSRFERKKASLRNYQDASGWRSGRPLTRGAAERLEAMNGLKLKKFWKWWSPERQNPENGWKWGSLARHISNMHT